jgi:hypothetical protein
VVAFESRAETSSGPRGFQPNSEMAGHPAGADVPGGDVVATPRRSSTSSAANWSSARCSLRAGQELTRRCGLSVARSQDLSSPQPSERASTDARGSWLLSPSRMRLRMAVVAVAAVLSTGAEAYAGQEWPHGVESAVQTQPPTTEDTHGQIHRHGRARNELHAHYRRPLGPPTEERRRRNERSSTNISARRRTTFTRRRSGFSTRKCWSDRRSLRTCRVASRRAHCQRC